MMDEDPCKHNKILWHNSDTAVCETCDKTFEMEESFTVGDRGEIAGLRARAQFLEAAGNSMACEVRNIMGSNTLFSLVEGERIRLRGLLRDIVSKWDSISGWTVK